MQPASVYYTPILDSSTMIPNGVGNQDPEFQFQFISQLPVLNLPLLDGYSDSCVDKVNNNDSLGLLGPLQI